MLLLQDFESRHMYVFLANILRVGGGLLVKRVYIPEEQQRSRENGLFKHDSSDSNVFASLTV